MRTWNEILSDSVLQAVDPSIEELETYLTDCEASPPKLRLDGASITGSASQLLPGIDSFSHHTV